jgi:hypothetical protein
MDPNEALKEILRLAAIVQDRCARGENPDIDGAADDLVKAIIGLDEWLAKGGFLPDAWNAPRKEALADLVSGWLSTRIRYIGETSSSITADYKDAIAQAKDKAAKVGLPWTDDFIPEYVKDNLTWAAEQEADEQ